MEEYEEIIDSESGETLGEEDSTTEVESQEEEVVVTPKAPEKKKRPRITSNEIREIIETPIKAMAEEDKVIDQDQLDKQFEKCKQAKGTKQYQFEVQKYFMLQTKINAIQQQCEAMDRLIMSKSPMTMNEYEILAFDHLFKKSVYRGCQLVDIHLKRKADPIKKDKVPIYVLVGKTSCGKSKLAQAFGNVLGKSAYPILNYTHNDTLGLSHWASSGSNVMVFDDFDFESATDKTKPSKIFELLKQWASGIEIHPRMALNTRRNLDNFTVKVKAIIISVNKITMETQNIVQKMPEFSDRIEYVPFTEADSYATNSWRDIMKYENASAVADRVLTQYLQMYLSIREWKPIFSEWKRYMSEYNAYPMGSIERKMVNDILTYEYPCFYPFSMGIYNESLVYNENL